MEAENMDDVQAAEMQLDLDKKLGRFFYNSSIPFRASESQYLLDFTKTLQRTPLEVLDYRPPDRKIIGGPILNLIRDENTENKSIYLVGTRACGVVDAWRNTAEKRLFSTYSVRNANIPNTFLAYRDISTEREFADNLLRISQAVVALAY
ncbi:hypothetical protein QAD02_020565 [Eretmocerus hayati]|uniref:Uncharacterized protein n=1 Tax=Eretmocerus hayati TaxID=131215 RepID=A0ACC2PMY5_9HYME|nr:hypothetical protein QAD02_020565 [Eretmocerus hayati]